MQALLVGADDGADHGGDHGGHLGELRDELCRFWWGVIPVSRYLLFALVFTTSSPLPTVSTSGGGG